MLLGRLKIVDKDRGWKRILKTIQETKARPYTSVGIHREQGERQHEEAKQKTVLEVASYHEFGIGVPERSFVRRVADAHGKVIAGKARILSGLILDGKMSVRRGLDLLGQFIKAEMRKQITNKEITPPNAPETIRRKSKKGRISDTPLLDSSQMLGSIEHEVGMRG